LLSLTLPAGKADLMLNRVPRLTACVLLTVGCAGTIVVTTPVPAYAGVSATVDVSTSLALRTGPARSHRLLGTLYNGTQVTVACKTSGERIAGNTTTDQWNQLTSGHYISHAYVKATAPIPTCTTPPRNSNPSNGGTSNGRAASRPLLSGQEPSGSMSAAQFIASAAGLAQHSQREYGVPASVTIAQAILESGWGRSSLASTHKNYFGIKCFNQGPIATGCGPIRGATAGSDPYRTYASVGDSFRDHTRLLTSGPRYQTALRHSGDANQFAVEIHRAGYATSPTYAADLQRVMTIYDLYQYDLH
jgi:flagellar protein FlgJ